MLSKCRSQIFPIDPIFLGDLPFQVDANVGLREESMYLPPNAAHRGTVDAELEVAIIEFLEVPL